uniref:Uncharacterized protein n=1 Tax=Paramoeba aestuarina TaxID=180227 RepID=A0A7S4P1M6_9EUKA|mmetsp:Transcript_34710/g.54146  ORF Transcript_34710/g.54146 Transcript_34710/m.54146 type:complete len:329 (+) Transcript_34710:30-1016(+)
MKRIVVLALLLAVPAHLEDGDEVLVEDVIDTPAPKLPYPSPPEKIESDKGKAIPKILRKYQSIKDINKYQILSMESLNLLKDFQDITDASTFADGNVMMELHRKCDEIQKLATDLQTEFQNMAPTEQKGFMEEYKQLLFNSLPQRLRHFKELSANHLALHQRLMESTLDVLQHDAHHSPLVDYIHSRLRHGQFSSESKLREMLNAQKKKRNKWIFGVTRLEWILLTGQVWLVSIAFFCLWKMVESLRILPKACFTQRWIFNAGLFGIVCGLVHVELHKYCVQWSFPKTRAFAICAVQCLFLCMIREVRYNVWQCLRSSKKNLKATAQK